MPAIPRRCRPIAQALVWGVLAGILSAQPGRAEETAPTAEKPQVKLDRLLELPPGLEYGSEKKGAYTRGEWRARFQELNGRLEYEKKLLEDAYKERQEVASSSDAWQVGLPGPIAAAKPADAPLDYELSQRIKRHKWEVERLERALLDLAVAANLAGVPDGWRE